MEVQLPASSSHHGLISMSRVCKSWREVVISYPLLWNTIYEESEVVTRICLERSKPLPLTISFSLSNLGPWSPSTWRLFGSHANRFGKLRLEGPVGSRLSGILALLTPGEGPLLLRELTLIGERPLDPLPTYEDLRSPILSEDIPSLHKLTLHSFPLVPQMTVLGHLVELHLQGPGPSSVNSLLDLLANNPGLQRVDIGGRLDNRDSPRGDLSIALPHLRNLLFSRCNAIEILRCLHLPRLGPLHIYVESSFEVIDLPRVYRPYSVIQLARDFAFHQIHLTIDSKFRLEIYDYSIGGITAGFRELPPDTAEVLGPSTVQFIKYLRFWEDREPRDRSHRRLLSSFFRMERLETLALECSPTSLNAIFPVLFAGPIVCPALRTLIIRFPPSEPSAIRKDALLEALRMRASNGYAIWKLRVIVPSGEQVPLYSGIFDSFVQEIEIIVAQPEWEDRDYLLAWED